MYNLYGYIVTESFMLSVCYAYLLALPNFFYRWIMSGNLISKVTPMFLVKIAVYDISNSFYRIIGEAKKYFSRHVGTTHVGLGEPILSETIGFNVAGKLRQTFYGYIKIFGDIILYMEQKTNATGTIYSPNGFAYYRIKSFILLLAVSYYQLKSNLQQEAMKVAKISGTLQVIFQTTYRTCADMLANYANTLSIRSIILVEYITNFKSTGLLGENVARFIKAVSICKANGIFRYDLRGAIGVVGNTLFSMSGAIATKFLKGFKSKGLLLNTMGDWFLKIQGSISPVIRAFVRAVPYRNQQFITNKRWFR